jgi:hypothetical protein
MDGIDLPERFGFRQQGDFFVPRSGFAASTPPR